MSAWMRRLMEHVHDEEQIVCLREFTFWSQLGEEQHKKELKEKIT